MKKLGWKPKVKLKEGLIEYCDYYKRNIMPNE